MFIILLTLGVPGYFYGGFGGPSGDRLIPGVPGRAIMVDYGHGL